MAYICPLPVKKLLFSKVKTVNKQYTFVPNLTVGCTKLYLITGLGNRKQQAI